LLLLSAGLGYQVARVLNRRIERVAAFWRRSLPWVVGVWGVVCLAFIVGRPVREAVAAGRLPEAAPDAPNVLLIVIDALRADHLPHYGYERDTSPTLARLAREGAMFESALSASPYTAPSHASLLTGRYPSEHGVQWLERRPILSADHTTLSEVLSEKGYRTAAISANRFWFTREQRFARGFQHFEGNYHALGDALVRTAYGRKLEEWLLRRLFEEYPWRKLGEDVTDSALDWVGERGDSPFFLMLNYFDVHDPYFPPDRYRGWYSDVERPGGILNSHLGVYHADLTPEQLQEEIDAYDGAIRYVDAEIERLLDGLAARGLDENLIVVVTADHGEAFGEHDAYIHANSLYLEETHVPLMVWAPGRVPVGFRSDAPVSHVTVPATIMDLVGDRAARPFRGPALSAFWTGATAAAGAPWPISEMEHWPWQPETSPSHYGAIRAVLSPEWHFIVNDSLGAELYRRRQDPREQFNLVAQDSLRSIVETHANALGPFHAERTGTLNDSGGG